MVEQVDRTEETCKLKALLLHCFVVPSEVVTGEVVVMVSLRALAEYAGDRLIP